jgi:hypothetical protein
MKNSCHRDAFEKKNREREALAFELRRDEIMRILACSRTQNQKYLRASVVAVIASLLVICCRPRSGSDQRQRESNQDVHCPLLYPLNGASRMAVKMRRRISKHKPRRIYRHHADLDKWGGLHPSSIEVAGEQHDEPSLLARLTLSLLPSNSCSLTLPISSSATAAETVTKANPLER